MCVCVDDAKRMEESAKRSRKHNFEFQLTYLSIYFYPIDFDCLRPLDQNAHYEQRMRRLPHRCGCIHKVLHLTLLHFSHCISALLLCYSMEFSCSCVSSIIIVIIIFFVVVLVFVIVLHFSCVCRLDRIVFLQQFYRCDVILNQISIKKIRYDMLPFAIPCTSMMAQSTAHIEHIEHRQHRLRHYDFSSFLF